MSAFNAGDVYLRVIFTGLAEGRKQIEQTLSQPVNVPVGNAPTSVGGGTGGGGSAAAPIQSAQSPVGPYSPSYRKTYRGYESGISGAVESRKYQTQFFSSDMLSQGQSNVTAARDSLDARMELKRDREMRRAEQASQIAIANAAGRNMAAGSGMEPLGGIDKGSGQFYEWGASSNITPGRAGPAGRGLLERIGLTKSVAGVLRSGIGAIVAGTIADVLQNEETYRQGMRMAGLNLSAQASSDIAYGRGITNAVPIIGPHLTHLAEGIRGAFGMDTYGAMESDVAMAGRMEAFSDMRMGGGLSAARGNMRARGLTSTPFGRSMIDITSSDSKRRQDYAAETDRQIRAAKDVAGGYAPSWGERMMEAGRWGNNSDGQMSAWGLLTNPWNEMDKSIRRRSESDIVTEVGKRRGAGGTEYASLAAQTDAETKALRIETSYQQSMQEGGIVQQRYANQYRPLQGRLAGLGIELGGEQARYAAQTAGRTASPEEQRQHDLNLQGFGAEYGAIAKELTDRILGGSTVSINAGVSPESFYDPTVESINNLIQALNQYAPMFKDFMAGGAGAN